MKKILYLEWIHPICHYIKTLVFEEAVFDVIIPLGISMGCSYSYYLNGKTILALDKLAELIPSIISILIGFTIMLITLLLTGSNESILDKLRSKTRDKKVFTEKVTLYQLLLIQFTNSLVMEIAIFLFVMFYLFLSAWILPKYIYNIFLCIFVFFLLTIIFSIFRGIINVYMSFFNDKK